MSERQVLVVDDEPDIRELLEITLARMDIPSIAVENLEQARRVLEQRPFALCLTDMRLPDGNGIDLVRFIQKHCPGLPVAMITAHGNVELAVEALKAGAFDFVSKPVDLAVLRRLVQSALKLGAMSEETSDTVDTVVGESPLMVSLGAKVSKLARSQAPVYISGESGTGKELAARMIHQHGPRAEAAFVPVNCGAIPEELMESEFFGHRKGSFTGAVDDKPGLFQAAEGGTLFLDEVADLPLHMQVKLLRAIQEKSVRPVGAQQEVEVDVRLLSATHKDLAALVQAGRFRQDLYYRVNVIELHVPALRERVEDISALAGYILERLGRRAGVEPPEINTEAMRQLEGYAFPGNVRELENILERAMTLCEGSCIEAGDLDLPMVSGEVESAEPLDSLLVSTERETILRALEETRWNKTAAARKLGISFGALRYRLQKLGLE